jgi:HPt (histidine-containing phosphotransfer) domain-containing protein
VSAEEQADGPIRVEIDDEIRDLIPRFLDNRRKEVTALEDLLARGDYEAIRRLGHTMKGMGGGYGFDRISELGQRLEQAARAESAGEIRGLVESYASYLERIEIVYV